MGDRTWIFAAEDDATRDDWITRMEKLMGFGKSDYGSGLSIHDSQGSMHMSDSGQLEQKTTSVAGGGGKLHVRSTLERSHRKTDVWKSQARKALIHVTSNADLLDSDSDENKREEQASLDLPGNLQHFKTAPL